MAAAFIFQPFFGALIPALGKPDALMCIMIVAVTFLSEKEYLPIVISGFIFGFIRDVASSQYIGTGVISTIAAVFVALLIKKLITVDEPVGASIMAFGSALGKQIALWILLQITGIRMGVLYMLNVSWQNILADAILILIFSFFAGRNRKRSDTFGNGFFV